MNEQQKPTDLTSVDVVSAMERFLEAVGQLENRIKRQNEIIVLQQREITSLGEAVRVHQRMFEALTKAPNRALLPPSVN